MASSYAIIEDSGTQIMVSEGDEILVDLRDLDDDAATLTFDKVLALGPDGEEGNRTIGAPYVEGAKVTADILAEERTDKVPVVKFKRRKRYVRRKSHRQPVIRVKITGITA